MDVDRSKIKEFVQHIRAEDLKQAKNCVQEIILNKVNVKKEKVINKYQTEI